jgi:hypothetical protein
MNPSNFSALAESKQEEMAFAACQLLLSLFADKERIVELTANIVRLSLLVAQSEPKLPNL